jgi:hypothetical protein
LLFDLFEKAWPEWALLRVFAVSVELAEVEPPG